MIFNSIRARMATMFLFSITLVMVISCGGLIIYSRYMAEGNAARLHLPSPLLVKSSDSILLHFQIDVNDKITSPQFPEADERSAAIANHHCQHNNP